jgi:hypothetical protein
MERLTKEQALLLSAYTGILLCDSFGDLHQYIEKIAGRPVFTHEMGHTKFMEELQEKLKPQILEIIYKSNN